MFQYLRFDLIGATWFFKNFIYKSTSIYLAIQKQLSVYLCTASNSCIISGIILLWIWMSLTLNFFSLLFFSLFLSAPLSHLITLFIYIQKPTYYYILMLYVEKYESNSLLLLNNGQRRLLKVKQGVSSDCFSCT